MLIQRFSNLEFNRWDALRSAIDQLIANGTYERFVRIHSDSWGRHRMHESMSGEVGRQRFLPWHRAYLINFERELRTIDESLSIPYWDWNADQGRLIGFSDLLGMLRTWPEDWPPNPMRTPENSRQEFFTDPNKIGSLLPHDNYNSFTGALETGPHNSGHGWVGGAMAMMHSPADPAFWFHHAQVDRIWALWQQNYPDEIADLSEQNEKLDPWDDEFTIHSVNDISSLGDDSYEYVEPCVTTSNELEWIPDVSLRSAVRSALNLGQDDPLTKQKMLDLTALRATRAGITNLIGLEHATHLTRLVIWRNHIRSLAPLRNLTCLTELRISRNNIHNLSPLRNLTNLTRLALFRNQITDVSPLTGLTNLQWLRIEGNPLTNAHLLAGLPNLTEVDVPLPVTIPDANLRAKIEEALGKTSGATITTTEMADLTELDVRQSNISDLTGLEHATNLTELQLYHNTVSNLSPLSGSTNLTTLSIYINSVEDISPLRGVTSLRWLSLGGNPISDLSPLSNLTNLESLRLWAHPISDLSPLSNLTNLRDLNIQSCRIADISPLSNLTNLTQLTLFNMPITDISPLEGLTNLTRLFLHHNSSLSNISALAGLTNLRTLFLHENRITDISPLSSLTNLTQLVLGDNSITDISPLVSNTGLGGGNSVDVTSNPLSAVSINTHIPNLQRRRVRVRFDAP